MVIKMGEGLKFPFKVLLEMNKMKDAMKGMGFDPKTIAIEEVSQNYYDVIFTFNPDKSAVPDIVGSVIPVIMEKSKEQGLDLKEIEIRIQMDEIKFVYHVDI